MVYFASELYSPYRFIYSAYLCLNESSSFFHHRITKTIRTLSIRSQTTRKLRHEQNSGPLMDFTLRRLQRTSPQAHVLSTTRTEALALPFSQQCLLRGLLWNIHVFTCQLKNLIQEVNVFLTGFCFNYGKAFIIVCCRLRIGKMSFDHS